MVVIIGGQKSWLDGQVALTWLGATTEVQAFVSLKSREGISCGFRLIEVPRGHLPRLSCLR